MNEQEQTVEDSDYSQFLAMFEHATAETRVAIFTHSVPDPDAIGSMMAMSWALQHKYGIEADMFYDGVISHPQNIALVNLLDPALRHFSEYNDGYDIHILVDTVPSRAATGEASISFELVIDHHRTQPGVDFEGLLINHKAGSCCATVYDLIRSLKLSFDDASEADLNVATALLVGIATDTENMMSDDATNFEFEAWNELFPYRNAIALKRIIAFERPKLWIDMKAKAVTQAKVYEGGFGIVGMGLIGGKHRDMIADMADEMVRWEDVHTAIAFAAVDGNRIEGSVRSASASVSVPSICKDLGGKHGSGGGKLGKGAYRYDLAGAGIDDEDDEETKEASWNLFDQKEKKRILRILKK